MKYAVILLLSSGVLNAQSTGMAFQNVNKLTDLVAPPLTPQTALRDVITGRPVSATEERHSLQILSDGTRIETKYTDKYYRDEQGRTRIEREDGSVLISDPVLGTAVEVKNGKVTGRSVPATPVGVNAQTKAALEKLSQMVLRKAYGIETASREAKLKVEAASKKQLEDEENLGVQAVNGVSAQGTRSVTTIPLGMIGNDRPIDIVNERWVSDQLQMTIKSSNKDPRFGETTYELTNIVLGHPDPTLFVIPPAVK
jgi:hypothetical protein